MTWKESFRLWKWSLFYLAIASVELGAWYCLRFFGKEWFMGLFLVFLPLSIFLLYHTGRHALTFLVLLAMPPIYWLREQKEKRNEFQRKTKEIDQEFKQYFWGSDFERLRK